MLLNKLLKQHPDQLTPIPVQDEWLVEWENTFSINLFPKHSYIKLYQRNKEMHSYGVWKITRPDRGTWHKIVWVWNSLPVQYLQVSACGRTVVCYQCWHWFARVRLEIFPGWTNKHSHSQHYQIVSSFQIIKPAGSLQVLSIYRKVLLFVLI